MRFDMYGLYRVLFNKKYYFKLLYESEDNLENMKTIEMKNNV